MAERITVTYTLRYEVRTGIHAELSVSGPELWHVVGQGKQALGEALRQRKEAQEASEGNG